jgi:PEGA domain
VSEVCVRWIALSDREAIGEVLSAEDASFLREHAATCGACRGEAELWGDLQTLVNGGETNAPQRQPRRRKVGVAAGLAAIVIAAAAALVFAWTALDSTPERSAARPSAPAPVPVAARVVVAFTSGGALEIDGRAGTVGQTVAQGNVLFARHGSACVEIEPAVRACLAKGSLVRVADTGPTFRLELLGGKVAAELDPLPAGTSFGVNTREGATIAVGTAFSVEVPPADSPVVTRVLHGTVVVRATTGAEQRVRAHEMTTAGGASASPPSALGASDEERERALFLATPAARGRAVAPVHVESDAPGSIVTLDGRVLGPAPVTVLLSDGDHTVDLAAPSRAPAHEPLRILGGAPVTRSFQLARVEPAAAPARAPGDQSAAAVLALARERRAHGDVDGSVAAYRELFERHAASVEAHAALVPYGELQLERLSDAGGALASFDRYLARGGPLEEEAIFGRIRALRALGRTGDERTAIENFVRRFPSGPLASSLRERLRAMEGL